MNARLCSLLVVGGVVLAGVHGGSLEAAALDAAAPSPVPTLKGAAFLPGPEGGEVLQLTIPDYHGVPRVQVFSNPSRVVVDLPGVNRGTVLSRREMRGLPAPPVLRWRLAQFSVQPEMTRLALEVAPGTHAEVSSSANGVTVLLTRGKGAVRAQLGPVQAPPAEPQVPVVVAAGTPLEGAAFQAVAPVAAQVPASVEAPLPVAVEAPLPVAVEAPAPVAAFAPIVQPVVAAPAAAVAQPVVTAASAAPAAQPVVTAAPAAAVALPVVTAAPVAPAAQPVVAPVAQPLVAATPAAPAKSAPAPLVPLPAISSSFQNLPTLAVNSLLPATPGLAQEAPLVTVPPPRKDEARKDGRRGGRTLGDVGEHYTGTRMTIDVVGTDLTSFLRIIADTAHLNLIVDSDVQGIYTFKFTDTPWDQVLDVILKHAGLGKEVSNGIIRVAKIEKLQKEEEDRKRLEDAKALSGETQSITRPLSFAKATDAKAILDKVLTKRGSLIIDERTNTLIITDLPRNLPLIDDLIAQLDVQIQQVQIEARVVEASKNWEQAFGVQWPTTNSGSTTLTTSSSSSSSSSSSTPWLSNSSPSWNSITNGSSTTVGFSPGQVGVTDISGAAGQFWLSFLSNRMSVNVILQALETEGVVKIISSPKVVTQNNKKAKVLSGTKIPYPAQQTGTSTGAITVSFADANLSLEVTPQITNDGTILMDIHVEKSDADFSNEVAGTPTITQKMIETQVLVKDGGTAIMGGVYKGTVSKTQTGVPFLSKLPLLGWLFRKKDDSEANDELLVFITPRILKN